MPSLLLNVCMLAEISCGAYANWIWAAALANSLMASRVSSTHGEASECVHEIRSSRVKELV